MTNIEECPEEEEQSIFKAVNAGAKFERITSLYCLLLFLVFLRVCWVGNYDKKFLLLGQVTQRTAIQSQTFKNKLIVSLVSKLNRKLDSQLCH